MTPDTNQNAWSEYREHELTAVTPILSKLGYELDTEQPHTGGERYLMHAVTTKSGRKLILLGRRKSDSMRVVIKTTEEAGGKRELLHERLCRKKLGELTFARDVFYAPEELFFGERDGRLISIQKFIAQESTFIARPLKEQFDLALKALKTQEGAHAATYGHQRLIARTFGLLQGEDYLKNFYTFKTNLERETREELVPRRMLESGMGELKRGEKLIEQYCGFLTHTDFVPHNIRVSDGKIYLLDHSSLRFGNKYEGWARFINFMILYNPPLADALIKYVRLNRSKEESDVLRLMRIYRLGEIIWYYARTLPNCDGDLHALNEARVRFWSSVLESTLENIPLREVVRDEYRARRDALRSPEEKVRQKDLH